MALERRHSVPGRLRSAALCDQAAAKARWLAAAPSRVP